MASIFKGRAPNQKSGMVGSGAWETQHPFGLPKPGPEMGLTADYYKVCTLNLMPYIVKRNTLYT